MINAGTAWLLSGYRDSEEKMVRNCSQVLLGTYAYAIKQAAVAAKPGPTSAGRTRR